MRADVYLFNNGLCDSRNKAQDLIANSRVTVDGIVINKASFDIKVGALVEILPSEEYDFVGRGGKKLSHALDFFNIDCKDKICVDIGASTGGFTECLLINGASKVYAVDSGKGQLANKLLQDTRVISIEGFNARSLTPGELDGNKVDIAVMDVSFISQKLLYPAIFSCVKCGGDIITLIKPQFEVGKSNLGKNGIVKNDKIRKKAVDDIIEFAKEFGFEFIGVTESPIVGGDGNIEFLLHLKIKQNTIA